MKAIIDKITKECRGSDLGGRVASYIPELEKADPRAFGIAVATADGAIVEGGDSGVCFTMQSVIKPVIFLLALMDNGYERVRELVGVEATGKPFDAFNYSDRALTGEHINPMVNAGAIALCSLIKGDSYEEKFSRLLSLTRKLAACDTLDIDRAVYVSEKATGNKNRALTYMLKAYHLIDDNVEDIVDLYFRACSVSVSCRDLARIALVLAGGGRDPHTHEQLFDKRYARYVNAIMTISGMYDGSGEFAMRVGVPAKSGVGGGIMAVIPDKMGIGIYSPALDAKGNSCAGVKALEILNDELDISIF